MHRVRQYDASRDLTRHIMLAHTMRRVYSFNASQNVKLYYPPLLFFSQRSSCIWEQ